MLNILKLTTFLLTFFSLSQAATIFFSDATNAATTATTSESTVVATTTPTSATTITSTSTTTITTTTSIPTVTLKQPIGLRCMDSSDATFSTPSYCMFSAATGHLEISRNQPVHFEEILPYAFKGLDVKFLNLSGLSLKKLNSKSFDGLANLNTLYLSNNLLPDLPNGVFEGLYSLNYLYLDSNQIATLSPPVFQDTFDLKKISLSHNKLNEIKENTFKYQNNLESISLDFNLFQSLNSSMFSGLNSLKQLIFSNNHLTKLDNDTLQNLSSLQVLDLSHNQIESLPGNLFIKQPYLNTFDISSNKLSYISALTFSNCRQLKTISMRNNKLQSIADNTFIGMDGMDRMDLSNNAISVLKANTFAGLTYLRYLVVRNNQIKHLPLGWLDSLGNLVEVDLSSNEISLIDSGPFDSPRRIQKIDFSNNKIQKIEAEWFKFNNQLTVLNLRGNKINAFNADSFSASSTLTNLDLGRNVMESDALVGTFKNLKQLKVLHLDGNSLTIFDADKAATTATIEELHLNATCLEEVRIQHFEWLKKINLKSNYFSSITKDNIYKLKRLEVLDLSDNNVTTIDSDFIVDSLNPTLLNFSMNALSSAELTKLTNVSALSRATVDLSWNKIDYLQNVNNFNKFYVAGNPLLCQCNQLTNIANYLSFIDYDKTVCKKDGKYKFLACFLSDKTECTQNFVSLPSNDLCSENIYPMNYTTRPILYKKSCKFPTPMIDFIQVKSTDSGFSMVWNSSNIESIKWFVLSWRLESNSTSNSSVSRASTVWYKSPKMQFSNNLDKAGLLDVCVETEPVFVSIEKNIKCQTLQFNGPQGLSSSLFPMLTYILIAVGIIILLIILSIVLAVCLRKKKNREADEKYLQEEKRKRLERNISAKSIVDPDVPTSIPEQSTLSIQLY